MTDPEARRFARFYDDYDKGTWLISEVNENRIIVGEPLLDDLSGDESAMLLSLLTRHPTLAADLALADRWRTVAHVLAESIAYHRFRTRHDTATCMPCKALAIYDTVVEEANHDRP